MKYAKLINGSISYAPNPIKHDGLWYSNPPGSVYEAEGYKPVSLTNQPEPPGVGWWIETWAETEDAYGKGDRVRHTGKVWESLVDANVWEPGAPGTETLWKET